MAIAVYNLYLDGFPKDRIASTRPKRLYADIDLLMESFRQDTLVQHASNDVI